MLFDSVSSLRSRPRSCPAVSPYSDIGVKQGRAAHQQFTSATLYGSCRASIRSFRNKPPSLPEFHLVSSCAKLSINAGASWRRESRIRDRPKMSLDNKHQGPVDYLTKKVHCTGSHSIHHRPA